MMLIGSRGLGLGFRGLGLGVYIGVKGLGCGVYGFRVWGCLGVKGLEKEDRGLWRRVIVGVRGGALGWGLGCTGMAGKPCALQGRFGLV